MNKFSNTNLFPIGSQWFEISTLDFSKKLKDVLENYDSILSCLKNQELINAFLDVLNPKKTYEEIFKTLSK